MPIATKLVGLLACDPDVRRSRFAWSRDSPGSPAPSNMIELLDRLDFVRGLGISPDRARRIHPARLGRLVDEGAIMTAQHIADLEPVRRSAILVAQVADLQTRLADATLAMFEKYMGSLFTKARGKDERRFHATKRDVAKALLLFRRTIFALKQAKATGQDGVRVVDREIGMARLERALPVIETAAYVADQDILVTAAEKYSVLRRFSPRFLEAFRFQSSTPNDPVLAAVELLRTTDTRVFAKRPPASFLPAKWRKLIFASGAADRRLPRPPSSQHCATGCAGATSGWPAAATTARSRTGLSPARRRHRRRARDRRRDRPRSLCRGARSAAAASACSLSRPVPRAANWMAWRSRQENSTSRAPNRRRRRRPQHACSAPGKACCRACASPRSWLKSVDAWTRVRRPLHPSAHRQLRPPTSRRCSLPSWPTARTWVCRAWPTPRTA